MSVSDHKPLFDLASHENTAGEICPQCQNPLKVKHIGTNSFWGCTSYPACDYTRSLHEEASFTPQPLPDSPCPLCQSPLMLKKGRYGFFIGCSDFPTCHYMADPEPEAPVALADCPTCKKGQLVERTNKYGKVFYACDRYPKCKFALNHKPQASPCPECDYPLLIEKPSSQGIRLVCPQKSCSYKSKPL